MTTYHPANDEKHQLFLAWSRAQGITFAKITPARFPNAGLGIASTETIEGPRRAKKGENKNRMGFSEGETITFTPKAALLTRENLRLFSPTLGDLGALLKELSTHAIFAAAIAKELKNKSNSWRPWMKVWPSPEEYRDGMPLLWTKEQQELLPPSAICAFALPGSVFDCCLVRLLRRWRISDIGKSEAEVRGRSPEGQGSGI